MKSLKQVAEEFDLWRNTRTKRTEIPPHLIALIKPLCASYKKTQILKALRISSKQLNQFIGQPPKAQPMQFLELPGIASTLASCELKRSDGTTLKIELPSNHLITIFQAFLCSNVSVRPKLLGQKMCVYSTRIYC